MAALSNFWQRVITGSLFLIIMVGSIAWSFLSFYLLFGIVLALATYEYLKITSAFAKPTKILLFTLNILGYLLVGISLLFEISHNPTYRLIKVIFVSQLQAVLFLLFPVMIVVIELFQKKEKPFENIAYSILGYILIGIPFVLLIQIGYHRIWGYNYQLILAYFLLLWCADSFSYVCGKLFGKHKLAPKISNGKTIEGTIGGIVCSVALSFLLPWLFPSMHYSQLEWVLFALLIAVVAVPSDLCESLLKRQAGIKDSGKILPGHGGILDRFDTVLLTAPVIYIYTNIIALT